MADGLRGVDDRHDARGAGPTAEFFDRIDAAERVRDVRECENADLRRQQRVE